MDKRIVWAFEGPVGSMSAHTIHSPFPQVTRLCDLSVEGDSVTSVGWSERVSTLALFSCWAKLAQGGLTRPQWWGPSVMLGALERS